jgi:ubiquinone/menaquinone biosynthesis C-methylase UbiE
MVKDKTFIFVLMIRCMKNDIEKWWNNTAKKYQKESKIGTDSAHYGPYSSNENKLRLLGNVKRKNILELGCGGGQCSISFAKQGAKCTGLDLSEEQIKHAKKLAKKEKVSVKFLKKDIQTLEGIKSESYDIVFSAFALQYVSDLTKCFKEISRVLKKKGIFVFSLDHPFYLSLSTETLKILNYNQSGKIEEIITWPDGSKHKFVMYKRKVSEIIDSVLESRLSLEKLIEPFDKKGEKAWKGGYWKNVYPKKLVEKVGPTIIFKTKKN